MASGEEMGEYRCADDLTVGEPELPLSCRLVKLAAFFDPPTQGEAAWIKAR